MLTDSQLRHVQRLADARMENPTERARALAEVEQVEAELRRVAATLNALEAPVSLTPQQIVGILTLYTLEQDSEEFMLRLGALGREVADLLQLAYSFGYHAGLQHHHQEVPA